MVNGSMGLFGSLSARIFRNMGTTRPGIASGSLKEDTHSLLADALQVFGRRSDVR